jgi:hypothetical protein
MGAHVGGRTSPLCQTICGHRTNITAESVKRYLAEREREAALARQHQAQRTPENREWERDRIAQEEKSGRYPGRHWDGKHWRDSDGKALRSHAGLTPNPFGPNGSTAVHGQVTPNNWVKVAYQNVIHFFQPGNDRGVAAIEFAIVAPVLILLMAVSVTLGMMQMAKQAVIFATQQAAVVQSTGGTPATIFAQNVASTPAANATVTCNTSGNVATCTGTAQFANPFAGVLGTGPTTPLTYSASVQVPQS